MQPHPSEHSPEGWGVADTRIIHPSAIREEIYESVIAEQPRIRDMAKAKYQSNLRDGGDMIRVSVSEGARLFGLSPQTIRRAIKDQDVRYVVVRGRYRIAFESLLEWSQRTTTAQNKLAQRGIGQYVDHWRIRNRLYSPNPGMVKE